ncbi:cyclopropane-fatty-acyl-phospholipid synthase family protein [Isoptericola sp. BMS4]|uniref:SAM-dependent methyltransferase n=1 Tax=Isoptericola sp. BMS4 TaxID=2527875 RepID=UPI001423B3CB|nr:methyltransferase domain-containing protein [Isoptericola sp. BMS4]
MTQDDDLRTYGDAAAADLTFNCPLGEARAADLVERLAPPAPDGRALDLGCGSGELLLRLCERHGTSGDGVDQHQGDLARARRGARERGLAGRVTFHETDATAWERPATTVVNVGAAHIWGDAATALAALRDVTAPAGTVLFADGVYEASPGAEVREIFGDLPDLATLARTATDAGFRVRHAATSTQSEWDDFESAWRAGVERVGTPGARRFADERREEYLGGYRDVVGFAWLVLTPA